MPEKKSSRIATFDLMRGYFLVAIVLNHLYYFPNGLDWLTMKGQLFVSSAEGFFFLSGIVLGIVRGAKLIQHPFRLSAWLLIKRSLQLYATYVVTTLLFILAGWWFFMDNPGLKDGILAADTPFFTMLLSVLNFSYLYGWTDYLRLYCLFIVLSPLAVWLLRRGWWWLVLAISLSVWHFSPHAVWPDSVFLQPYNWQVIFFSGMIVGFHWKHISGWWTQLSRTWKNILTSLTLSVTAVSFSISLFLAYGGKLGPEVFAFVSPIRDTLAPYFNKENLPFARLVAFFFWFWAAFWLFHKLEKPIMRWFGWLLMPFGTNSLYVYIVSGFIIFFVHLYIPLGSIISNFLVTVAILGVIWLMIRYKVLMKIIPR